LTENSQRNVAAAVHSLPPLDSNNSGKNLVLLPPIARPSLETPQANSSSVATAANETGKQNFETPISQS